VRADFIEKEVFLENVAIIVTVEKRMNVSENISFVRDTFLNKFHKYSK
jgi:hypothetical protein